MKWEFNWKEGLEDHTLTSKEWIVIIDGILIVTMLLLGLIADGIIKLP